jgi:HEAT repeat protein
VGLLLLVASAHAQENRVETLVARLDAPDFKTRHGATAALIDMGKAALLLLDKAPTDVGKEARARIQFIRMTVDPPALPQQKAKRIGRLVHVIATSQVIGPGAPADRASDELVAMGPAALPALFQAIGKPRETVWSGRCLRVVQKIGGRSAAVPLTYYLAREPRCDRARIAETLGILGDPMAVPALLAVASDREAYVRCCVARALGALVDERGVPALLEYLRNEPEHTVRWYALEAIASFDDAIAQQGFHLALRDKDGRIVDRALDIVQKRGNTSLIEPLKAVVLNRQFEPLVRTDALSALSACGDERIVPFLISLLDHEQGRVRTSALAWLNGASHVRGMPQTVYAQHKREEWARCKQAWEAWWRRNSTTFLYRGGNNTDWLAKRVWGQAADRCRMSIQLESDTIRFGEPIRLDIVLQITPGDPPHRVVDLDLSRPGGNFPFTPILAGPDGLPLKPVKTEPDNAPLPPPGRYVLFSDDPPMWRRLTFERTRDGLLKAYDRESRRFLFFDISRSGAYRLQIRYLSGEERGPLAWPRELLSNTVDFQVVGE